MAYSMLSMQNYNRIWGPAQQDSRCCSQEGDPFPAGVLCLTVFETAVDFFPRSCYHCSGGTPVLRRIPHKKRRSRSSGAGERP